MSWKTLCCRTVWLLLYYTVTIYQVLHRLISRLFTKDILWWSYDQSTNYYGRNKQFQSWRIDQQKSLHCYGDYFYLRNCKAELEKIPKHLSVIIGPNDIDVSEEVIGRLIMYALVLEIDCISLYDTRLHENGHLSLENFKVPSNVQLKRIDEGKYTWALEGALQNVSKSVNGAKTMNGTASTNHTKISHEESIGLHKEINENGKLTNLSIEINEISKNDGRPLIAEICRQLFEKRRSLECQDLVKDRTRLAHYIDIQLRQRLNWRSGVDPELCIIFHQDFCTFGMLPWHTRFTEFHRLDSRDCFDARTFARILYRYSRCEQRWGK